MMRMEPGAGAGCVFDHRGRVPASIHTPTTFASPLEEAVYANDVITFINLVKEGAEVSVRLTIGEMSCLEYAAMMGHTELLRVLLEKSMHVMILQKYFSTPDVVERAYMISKNKSAFFEQRALAEANRYESAVFTAVLYNQPACLDLLLSKLGCWSPGNHSFYTPSGSSQRLSPLELAQAYGHVECVKVLQNWRTS